MTYKAWQKAYGELRDRYRDAHVKGLDAAAIDVDMSTLYNGQRRIYALSDRLVAKVGCESFMIWIGLERRDLGMVLLEPHRMSAAEIRVVADVREMADLYERGVLSDLAPSGNWADVVKAQIARGGTIAAFWVRWTDAARRVPQ